MQKGKVQVSFAPLHVLFHSSRVALIVGAATEQTNSYYESFNQVMATVSDNGSDFAKVFKGYQFLIVTVRMRT